MRTTRLMTVGVMASLGAAIAQSEILREHEVSVESVDTVDQVTENMAHVNVVIDASDGSLTARQLIEAAAEIGALDDKKILVIGAGVELARPALQQVYELKQVYDFDPWKPLGVVTPLPSRQEKQEMRRQAMRPHKMQAMAAKCRRR